MKDLTKRVNIKEFKLVKSDEEVVQEEEKRKEMRTATPEEIAEEMKVPVADRVTPYHKLQYEEQIEKKRE